MFFGCCYIDVVTVFVVVLSLGSQVVIAEHGAFQSNIMYMRRGSLFIELRGQYGHVDFAVFENIARMFGVFYEHIVTENLVAHRQREFNISYSEMQNIVEIVKLYHKDKPFQQPGVALEPISS